MIGYSQIRLLGGGYSLYARGRKLHNTVEIKTVNLRKKALKLLSAFSRLFIASRFDLLISMDGVCRQGCLVRQDNYIQSTYGPLRIEGWYYMRNKNQP